MRVKFIEPDGRTLLDHVELPLLPRKGEKVRFWGEDFVVTDVIWYPNAGSGPCVNVTLEDPEG